MDTVTHGLTGWLVARALPDDWKGDHPTIATAVVALGSVLPDADNAASLLGSALYFRIHRGLSHSLLGISVSSLVVARCSPASAGGRTRSVFSCWRSSARSLTLSSIS